MLDVINDFLSGKLLIVLIVGLGGYFTVRLQTWGAGGVLAGLSSLAMLNVILVLFLLQLVRKQ